MGKLFYLIKEGFKNIFVHGFMSFASVTIIAACLIIMGSFSLLAINIDNVIKTLESQNEVIAYVDESYTTEQAAALKSGIESVNNVSSAVFVTREEAMQNFVAQYKDTNLFSDINASIFRDRYVIYMNDIGLMQETIKDVKGVSGVADVNASIEVANGFITVRNVVTVVSLVLVAVLAVVSMFIIANTIKLATFGRREEIAVMKMVGAGNTFIRFPFIIEGFILGLIGGGIAFGAEYGLYTLLCNKLMATLVGSYITVIPLSTIIYPVLIVYLAFGFVVGTFGGIIAIRNYLKV